MKSFAKWLFLAVTAGTALCATAAPAKMTIQDDALYSGCGSEQGTVSITLNDYIPADTGNVRGVLDQKMKDIETAATHVDADYTVRSKNYSVTLADNGYRLSGSLVLLIEPADKTLAMMQALVKKGYVARASINSYNNGNCATGAVPIN